MWREGGCKLMFFIVAWAQMLLRGYNTTQLTTSHKDCSAYSTELLSILHFGKPTFSDIHLSLARTRRVANTLIQLSEHSAPLLHSEVEPRGDFWTARGGAVWRLLCSHYSSLLKESLAWPASQLSITAQPDHQVGRSPEWRAHSSELPAGKEEIKK